MRAKRKYDPDFKEEAVRLVLEENLTIRAVERNLGISHGVLKDWVQKHRERQEAILAGRDGTQSSEAELKQLRKENEQLRRERDILKKAVAIFSKARIDIRVHNRAPLRIWSQGDVPCS